MNATDSDDDQEVVNIANLVAEAKGHDIPSLIMQLKDIMDKYPPKSDALRKFKKTVWNYDLLSWCADSLKLDFSRIQGGLGGAVRIASVLCECCCSLNIKDSLEFFNSTLPSAVQSILHLIRIFQLRLSEKVPKPLSQARSDQMYVEQLFDNLNSILSVYPHVNGSVLNSNDLIRIFMDDGKFFTLSTLSVLKTVVQVNRASLKLISEANLLTLLDEFVYVLTVSEDAEIACATTRLLVLMCESRQDIVSIISKTFKGLKTILSRWSDQGFNRDLNLLISFLDVASEKNVVLALQKNAARKIWAFYMGWKTRKRMKTLHRSLPTLQRSFRKKFREKQETEVQEKMMRLQATETKIEKQRRIRQTHEKMLQSMEIVPAEKLPNFLRDEERRAAVTIQAHWRAFAQRKTFSAKREVRRKTLAAIKIQRGIRNYLASKSEKSSIPQPDISMLAIEEKRRYKKEIELWRAVNKRVGVSRDEALKTQEVAHKKLVSYYANLPDTENDCRKIDTLLARIHTEEETLNHLPSLDQTDSDTIDRLACSSQVIQRAGAIEHNKEMKQLKYSWWKKLALDQEDFFKDGW